MDELINELFSIQFAASLDINIESYLVFYGYLPCESRVS